MHHHKLRATRWTDKHGRRGWYISCAKCGLQSFYALGTWLLFWRWTYYIRKICPETVLNMTSS